MRKFLMVATFSLVSCGQSPENPDAATQSASPPAASVSQEATPAAPAAGGDHCSLIADTQAIFGHPVTASEAVASNSKSCLWNSADGRVCGSVTVLGPGWNEVPDVKANYVAMATSLAAFGQIHDVAGIGEDAKAVDGGMLGAQLAFRTSKVAVLVAATSCTDATPERNALAVKLARAITERL